MLRNIFLILSLLITNFSQFVYTDEFFTKYDIGDTVTINCVSNYDNYIFIGTRYNGLIKLDRINGTVKAYTPENGFLGNYISSICPDKNGSIYVGVNIINSEDKTLNKFFIHMENDSLKNYSSELLYPHTNSDYGDSIFYAKPNIPSIVVDNNNVVYVAANYWVFLGGHNNINTSRVYSYDGNIWEKVYESAGDYSTINYLAISENNELVKGKDSPQPWGIRAPAFDKKGGLWMAHPWNYPSDHLSKLGVGWVEYSLKGVSTQYDSTNSVIYSNIYSIAVDENNTAWFGGNKLISYNGTEWKIYKADNWTDDTKIIALRVDDDGYIWVGTYKHGLWRFDANNATAVETAKQTPSIFSLSTAYPNPFNASTTISFTLNKPEKVNLAVYSLTGQKVRELAAGNYSAGSHTAVWDGRDDSGNAVSSGVYLTRMESGGVSKVVRMAMVK